MRVQVAPRIPSEELLTWNWQSSQPGNCCSLGTNRPVRSAPSPQGTVPREQPERNRFGAASNPKQPRGGGQRRKRRTASRNSASHCSPHPPGPRLVLRRTLATSALLLRPPACKCGARAIAGFSRSSGPSRSVARIAGNGAPRPVCLGTAIRKAGSRVHRLVSERMMAR